MPPSMGMSDDFLYQTTNHLKSQSLINHASMTNVRNEMLSLSLLNSHSPSMTSTNVDNALSSLSIMNISNHHRHSVIADLSPSNISNHTNSGSIGQAQTPSTQSQDDCLQRH